MSMTKCSDNYIKNHIWDHIRSRLQCTAFIILILLAMSATSFAAIVKWSAPTAETYASVIVDESKVYSFSAAGTVNAFDRLSGSRLWTTSIGASPAANALRVKDVLYVPASDGVYAVGTDGRSKGNLSTGDAIATPLLYYENLLIAVSHNGTMYVLDATKELSKAALLRTITLGGKTVSSAVAHGGKVYVILDTGDVLSVDPFTGTKLRIATLDIPVPHGNPVVVNNTLIFGAERSLIALTLVGAKIGAVAWRDDFDAWVNSIMYSDGRLYVGANDGALYIIDAFTGSALAKFQTGDAVRASPLITRHTVYVASNDNTLYALDVLNISSQKWSMPLDDWPTAPQYMKGMIYTVTANGTVYAISTLDCGIEIPATRDKIAADATLKGIATADAGIAKVEVRTVPGDWTEAAVRGTGLTQGTWSTRLDVRGFSAGDVPLQCRVTDLDRNIESQPFNETIADYVFSLDRLPLIIAKYPQRIDAAKQFTVEFFKDENTTLKNVEVVYDGKTYTADEYGRLNLTSPPTEGKITFVAKAPNYQPLTATIDVGRSPITLLIYGVIAVAFIAAAVYIFIRSRAWR